MMKTNLNLSTMNQGEIILSQPDEKLSPNREMETSISSMIMEMRGQQVILDCNLAVLYGVETKRLKEQVNRNIKRFPPDFMFRLNPKELCCLRSQFATSNKRGGTRYAPYAFTSELLRSAKQRVVLIIDDTVYHIGASLKDLGKKLFAFSKMELAAHEIGIE